MDGSDTGGFRGYRDVAGTGTPGVRDTQVVGAPPPLHGQSAGARPTAEPVPAARAAANDSPEPLRTVERHLDEILAAVPEPDSIELAVLDAQGLLCAEDVISQRARIAFDPQAVDVD